MTTKTPITTYLFSTVGVAAMFFILIAVYLIGGVVKERIDLTQDRLYTLSAGTKAILKKLDTPVEIRFYYSRSSSSMPMYLKTHAQRIEDLLEEYRKAAKGLIKVKEFDPQPLSDAEDSANLDGIEGQMTPTGEKIYLGLAISCADIKSTTFLPFEREKLLEYDISRAISQVIRPEKPVIGVMSGLPVMGEMNPMMMQMGRMSRQDPWVCISELKRDYTVKQVEMTTDKIDDDIGVLLVIYPKDISDKAQFAIDQFVLRGGRLISFLAPMSMIDGGMDPSNLQRSMGSGASMDKLLKAWGVDFDKQKVVADMRYVTRLNRGNGPESWPTVLSLNHDAVDTNDVVTSQIDNLLVAFPGAFGGTPAEGLKRTVILSSSTDSQLAEKMMAQFSPQQVIKDFVSSGKKLALAIRLTGKFKTAFPDGKPKEAEPKENEAKKDEKKDTATSPALKESKTDGAVVLVGSSDMLYDNFCGQVQNFFGQKIFMPANQNVSFLQSLVEQMSGDSNLISMRSRATMGRPFTVVKKLQAEAEARWQSKIKELEKRKADVEQKISELQNKKEGNQRFILSPEQQAEIQRFRQDQANTNRELKDVSKSLRRDIDSLETRVQWVDIAGMPFLVTASGIALALIKRKKTAAK
jgi:ABC-type uncharacterized transport system involved in gliding motility auxiliary subunit